MNYLIYSPKSPTKGPSQRSDPGALAGLFFTTLYPLPLKQKALYVHVCAHVYAQVCAYVYVDTPAYAGTCVHGSSYSPALARAMRQENAFSSSHNSSYLVNVSDSDHSS